MPDEVVRHQPAACSVCGTSLADAPVVSTQTRQVFDLPEVAPARVDVPVVGVTDVEGLPQPVRQVPAPLDRDLGPQSYGQGGDRDLPIEHDELRWLQGLQLGALRGQGYSKQAN